MTPDDAASLRAELEAIPKGERLDYLAGLPNERRELFARILPPDDRRKLIRRIDLLEKKRREPTLE